MPSTVVDVTGDDPVIVREGPVSLAELRARLPVSVVARPGRLRDPAAAAGVRRCGACSGAAGRSIAGLDLAGGDRHRASPLHGVLLLAAFGLHLPLWSIAVAAVAIGVAALAVAGVPPLGLERRAQHVPFVAIGLAAGLAGWRLWTLGGDAPYHVGRVRRLLALDRLHLARMPELVDGSNHPGYYVPLPHAVVAESAWITGASPTRGLPRVARHARPGRRRWSPAPLVWSLLHDRPPGARGLRRSPPRPASPACASGRSSPTRRASRRSSSGPCS